MAEEAASTAMQGDDETVPLIADENDPLEKDKENVGTNLPQGTQHEDEAEARLVQALQNDSSPKSMLNLNTDLEALEAIAAREASTAAKKREEVSLAQNAQYLMALHGGGEDEGMETMEEPNTSNLEDASATERIVKTGGLFRAAATRNLNSSQPPASKVQNGEHVPSDEADVSNHTRSSKSGLELRVRKAFIGFGHATVEEWSSLKDFYKPKQASAGSVLFFYCWSVMTPCLCIAALLFYGVDNPPTGRCTEDLKVDNPIEGGPYNPCRNEKTSTSWWLIFIGCRQILMWLLARASEEFFVDFLLLQHPFFVRILGPRISLIVVQSKGWPAIFFGWAFWCSMLLYGTGDFPQNWMYWQNGIKMFTDENPSGGVTSADTYGSLLLIGILMPTCVCLKRHFLGLHMGARLYTRYNERLQEIMQNVVLISELSLWVRRKRDQHATYQGYLARSFDGAEEEEEEEPRSMEEDNVGSTLRGSSLTGESIDPAKFLDAWDEPERKSDNQVSGKHIIEFEQAFQLCTKPLFFSSAFGPVESREECIKSSEILFRRLLKIMNDGDNDSLDFNKVMRWLLRGCKTPEEKEKKERFAALFCPAKDGQLYIIDFIGAIDEVYKKVRLLQSAVKNSSHIDKSYESLVNIAFYFIVGVIALQMLGLNPWSLIVPLGAFLISLSFMIGDAAAQVFEGVLLILVRQPYDIGDRIAIAEVDEPASLDGSTHWLVEKIDLMKTVAKLTGTNELASFSNGSLARTRLFNMNRSPDAVVYVKTRFALNVPYSTIMIFRSAVEKFVEKRPQEWIGMLGFRTNRVEVELNFVEYTIVLKHQNAWQNILPVLESKAAVASFCMEAQKKLGCHYQAPPMGVEITIAETEPSAEQKSVGGDDDEIQEESIHQLMELAETFGSSNDE
mmetsp:Transcript_6362/g.13250  ORF Transcript_6362/g.13250 Transcript_6362/m.13250 type:complete len:903 (-) Transcript_6362:51-2759(-)|eukprot:CAMPEP_0172457468 /NCGR_PEP_ID=MMETSP1065-20121228/22503_1 /TAXON_ID=265537 /ORGANISM="Amphiprora paludosa, Strain CCMP125" /LENGTH=902 /DNA_ID=CAMNT_0013211235 /DNA_START=46 /DNA_END=2754 /DNA_ORIENTATION=-